MCSVYICFREKENVTKLWSRAVRPFGSTICKRFSKRVLFGFALKI